MKPRPSTTEFDRSNHQLTVYIDGELDQNTAPLLTDEIFGQVRADDESVRLDLSHVSFCGSAGIALLLRVQAHAADMGVRFTIYDPSPAVRRVLEVCNLGQQFQIWTPGGATKSRARDTAAGGS